MSREKESESDDVTRAVLFFSRDVEGWDGGVLLKGRSVLQDGNYESRV